MEVEAAKLVGAGLAVVGLGGVGIGIGSIFSSMIASGARKPAAVRAVVRVLGRPKSADRRPEQARCLSSIQAPSCPSCSGWR